VTDQRDLILPVHEEVRRRLNDRGYGRAKKLLDEALRSGEVRTHPTAEGQSAIIDRDDLADWLDRIAPAGSVATPAVTEPEDTPILHTGAPGRPPKSMHLIKDEHARRVREGEAIQGVSAEAQALLQWLKTTSPKAPRPELKTIENNIRGFTGTPGCPTLSSPEIKISGLF
jgi:hypothetical protein